MGIIEQLRNLRSELDSAIAAVESDTDDLEACVNSIDTIITSVEAVEKFIEKAYQAL